MQRLFLVFIYTIHEKEYNAAVNKIIILNFALSLNDKTLLLSKSDE